MKVTISCKKVANILKLLVNNLCEDGFKWYPDAHEDGETSTLDFNEAIRVLEGIEDKTIEIQEVE